MSGISDSFELFKSTQDQSLDKETPFAKQDWGYINDLQNGSYQNSAGVTLVNFDLSALYNSVTATQYDRCFLAVPIITVARYVSNIANGNAIAPVAGSEFQVGFKSGYYNMLQSADVQIGGTSIAQTQPNINFYKSFETLTSMCQDDLEAYGSALGIFPDNPMSLVYNTNTTTQPSFQTASIGGNVGPSGGQGFANNAPFSTGNLISKSPAGSSSGVQSVFGGYGTVATGTYNFGLMKRMQTTSVPITNSTTATANGLYGASTANAIASITTSQKEFRNFYAVGSSLGGSANDMVWTTTAIIRLSDVSDFFARAPLLMKTDAQMRLYFNTGALGVYLTGQGNVGITNGINGLTGEYMAFSAANSTFTQTCPLVVCNVNAPSGGSNLLLLNESGNSAAAQGNCPGLVVSMSIQKNTTTAIFNTNLGASSYSHPMGSVRLYYPLVKLKASIADHYFRSSRAKKVVYESQYVSSYIGISAASTFSQVVQSAVSNLKGVCIIPFASVQTNGLLNAGTGVFTPTVVPFADYSSPFSMAPNQTGPISLISLNVRIGQMNLKQDFLNYTFENFLEETGCFNKIQGSDFGMKNGLISQYMWENAYRVYYLDAQRGELGDTLAPKNVSVTFVNNSLVTIDAWIICTYYEELVLDCITGVIQKVSL